MVDSIRKSPRTAVGALSILPQPPPGFLHDESDDISSRGGVAFPIMSHGHLNRMIVKTKRGRERYEDAAPPRPVLIRGFVPGGLIGVVSRGMGCAFVGR